MAPKQITHSDLNELELKISKEQTDRRHEDRDKMQKYYCFVDDIKTDNALLKQSNGVMAKTLEKIEEGQKELTGKFDLFISKAHETFATKEDHKKNETKIIEIEKGVNGINLKIAVVSGGFAVIVFIIDKIFK